jgi:hypothetical protein
VCYRGRESVEEAIMFKRGHNWLKVKGRKEVFMKKVFCIALKSATLKQ